MCKMPCFRERLNQLLTDSGKSIVDFAKTLGTSRQSLGYYLNGERIPDAHMVKQICERCSVSADWLLGLSGVRSPDTNIQAISQYTGLSEKSIKYLSDKEELILQQKEHMEPNEESPGALLLVLDSILSSDRSKFDSLLESIFYAYFISRNQTFLTGEGFQHDGLYIDQHSVLLNGKQALEFEEYCASMKFKELLPSVMKSIDEKTEGGIIYGES